MAKSLVVYNVSQVLCVQLTAVVDAIVSHSPQERVTLAGPLSSKVTLPPLDWLKVWLTALRLCTKLLRTLGHHFINVVLDFVATHYNRLVEVSGSK